METAARFRWVLALLASLAVPPAAQVQAQQAPPRAGNRPVTQEARPKQEPPPPAAAKTEVPSVPTESGELQPVMHARNAGIVTCLDGIARAATGTIEAPHAAMSNWLTGAADQGPFSSIIAMTPANRAAPNAAAFIHLSPTSVGGCQGSTVQVVPTARSCGAMQADFSKDGRTVANLAGIPVILRASGERYLLLQAPGGCVIVSINLVATGPALLAAPAPAAISAPKPAATATR
jgi:hypothetical protein